ncbi:acyltransferase family protein [Massilia aurea]|uniref:acyltransferase family protein n=1 Tax=Massilia aurea TaxID=373040 RepID=UPI003462887B
MLAAQHLPYRADIDGMRGIAVAIVVLFHAFPALIPGGFIGVDIFFVLSGFLISKILMAEFAQNAFSYGNFYARRARRIFPALIVVMAATLAFGWLALFPDELKMLGKHMVGGASFLSNVFLWFEVGYFDTAAETKPLLHLWSLGIEEQFYIFWPILLALAFRFRASVFWLTVTLLVASLLVNVGGIKTFPSATFYSIASRAWELLIGALLACLSMQKVSICFGSVRRPASDGVGIDTRPMFDSNSAAGRNLLAFLGLVFIVLACIFVRGDKGFPGWWALLPTLGAASLLAAGPTAWINRVILSNRLLVWIGLISYPLYLWHWPLLSFAQIVESGVPAREIRIAAVASAVLLAWLTYKLFEQPIRTRGGRHPAVAIVLTLLVVALGGIGGWVYKQDGLPARASIVENANFQKALNLVEDRDNAAACKQRYGFDTIYEYCLLAKVDQAPTIALLGDSHGYHVSAGLTKYYSGQGENLIYLGTGIPFFDVPALPHELYQGATTKMFELVLSTDSIKKVMISTMLKLNLDTSGGRMMVEKFRGTLKKLLDAGKEVTYLYDVPTLDFDPRACIKRPGVASSTNRDCTMDVADYNRVVQAHNEIVASVLKEFPTVKSFDPSKYLCDQQHCKAKVDGKLMYRDTNHLTYDGDLYIGARYAEEQKARAR